MDPAVCGQCSQEIEDLVRSFNQMVEGLKEKEKLQQMLVTSEKMAAIGTLSGGIAHDFNNVLGIIQGNAQLLEMRYYHKDPETEELIDTIICASKRGTELTRSLLSLARGGRNLSVGDALANVNDVIQEATGILERTFHEKIRIIKELSGAMMSVRGDATQIYQVILNMCVNARDAMPTGGTLTLSTQKVLFDEATGGGPELGTHPPGHYVLVAITDTGDGMDEETRKQIFDPFFTTKGRDKGTGIGLTVCHRIIRSLKGWIDVKSEKGKGTTFNLYLPASAEMPKVKISKMPPLEERFGTILILDDEAGISRLNKAILEKNGYDAIVAMHHQEAIEIFERQSNGIRMVILDHALPGISGADVFEKLKAVNPDVKVLMTTGNPVDLDKQTLMKRGLGGIVEKPYTYEMLLDAVHDVLAS